MANYTNHSEDSEHGSACLLAHLEQEIPQASSTTSNNYNRDGNWPEFLGKSTMIEDLEVVLVTMFSLERMLEEYMLVIVEVDE